MNSLPNNNLGESLVHTITNSELASVAGDIAEVALDSVLVDGVLKDLPIIGSFVGLLQTGATVKDYFFFKKLLSFLKELSSIPMNERTRMLEKMQEENFTENIGEKLLIVLDRFESSKKAQLLGMAFKIFVEETITPDEFWRVSFVLERLPLNDVLALKDWKSLALDDVEHIRKHLYLSVGLGWFVIDMSSTGFQWQERLCAIYSEYLLI